MLKQYMDSLVQDCDIYINDVMEVLQSCIK